jgi:hypothetical protein
VQALDIFAAELTADPEVYRRWVVTLPGREPFAVIVVPAANAAQLRLVYPAATGLHAIPEGESD